MRKVEVERLYCDCCGIEVDNFYSSFVIPKAFCNMEYDMCGKCHKKLHKFLKELIKIKKKKNE